MICMNCLSVVLPLKGKAVTQSKKNVPFCYMCFSQCVSIIVVPSVYNTQIPFAFQNPQACSSMLTSRSSSSSVKSPSGKSYHHHHHHHPHVHTSSSTAHHGPVSPPRLPHPQNTVHPQQGDARQGWASPNRELEVNLAFLLFSCSHINSVTRNFLNVVDVLEAK